MVAGHDIALGLRAAYLSMQSAQTDGCLADHGATADQFVLLGVLARQRRDHPAGALVRRASSDPTRSGPCWCCSRGEAWSRGAAIPPIAAPRNVHLTREGRQSFKRLLADTESLRERLLGAFRPEEAAAAWSTSSLARSPNDGVIAAGRSARKAKGENR